MFVPGRQDDSSQSGVDRQAGQFASQFGQALYARSALNLNQSLVSVTNCLRAWRIKKRKRRDVSQTRRFGLQDHRGQIRAMDFWRCVIRSSCEIGLAIEPNANAIRDSAAPPCPLVGGGLGYPFDGQPLHFGTRRIPTNAGRAGVDHVANAGNRQGGLGHVRCKDNSAVRTGLKNAILLLRRQSCVQRQDLGSLWRRRPAVSQPRNLFAVSRMSRSVGRKTSMWPRSTTASSWTAFTIPSTGPTRCRPLHPTVVDNGCRPGTSFQRLR